MMDPVIQEENEAKSTLATLNPRQLAFLSQTSQEIRTTVSHLTLPKISPLSVLDSSAIDSLRDLFYVLNTEDPLNSMPVRRYILVNNIPKDCLFPITVAADSDPAAERNRKRWALPIYQTLRLLSVLTLPIATDSELPKPSQLDYLLLDLRAQLASHRETLAAYVSLLLHYIDRKAEKRAALAPAEEAKREDARIDNILRFFSNLLSPPRRAVAEEIIERDRPVHTALVGSLVSVDFYSTLAVLFPSAEEGSAHYTDLIFLVADIYALTYRHSSPRQMFRVHLEQKINAKCLSTPADGTQPAGTSNLHGSGDVFDPPNNRAFQQNHDKPIPVKKVTFKMQRTRHAPSLRDALRLERSAIGGARAITASARWSSRHSGGFMRTVKPSADAATTLCSRKPNGETGSAVTRILSARGAIQQNKTFNPKQAFQDSIGVNSQILCQLATRGRSLLKKKGLKQKLPTIRHDLQEEGAKGLVTMTNEFLDTSFSFYVRELRNRISETKDRAQAEEMDALLRAQRAYLSTVGSVIGFYREKCGKVFKREPLPDDADDDFSSQFHRNNLTRILESDFKIIKMSWKSVEAALELESFQLVFSVLVQACERTRESGKDESTIELVELSTFSILEMVKMLQGMAAVVTQEIEEAADAKQGSLTPREIALNTLEQLFERESFLNAPADLAKHFNSKVFSFQHLCNIVEMAHAFTTILLNEQEFSKLSVAKKKRKKEAKSTIVDNVTIENGSGETDKTVPNQNSDSPVTDGVVPSNRSEGEQAETGNTQSAKDRQVGPDEGRLRSGNEMGRSTDESSEPLNPSAAQSSNAEGLIEPGSNAELNGPVVTSENASTPPTHRELSQVEKMLLADQESAGVIRDIIPTSKEPSRIEKMIMTDIQANSSGAPEPKYVTKLGGEDVGDIEVGDESDEENIQEVESIGIVRRYAHGRAIEALMVPIRVALCQTCDLSGKSFPVPESAEVLTQPVIVAKSVCVLSAVWKVATKRERGALCGQFFSFSILQLLSIVLNAEADGFLRKESVLAHMCELAKDVTDTFFKWLKVNPGVMYDLFLAMDKGYAMSMARKVNGADAPDLQLSIPIKPVAKRAREKQRQQEYHEVDDLYDSDELADIDEESSDEEKLVKKMNAKVVNRSVSRRHTRNNPVPDPDGYDHVPSIGANISEGSEPHLSGEKEAGTEIVVDPASKKDSEIDVQVTDEGAKKSVFVFNDYDSE